MIIDAKVLANMEKSMRIQLTPEQRQAVLQSFGVEPEPHEWSEQDISEQIRHYLKNGAICCG